MLQGLGRQQEAEGELIELVSNDPNLSKVMARHGASDEDLRQSYRKLCSFGAGQWTRGHYVAASALAFGPTLDFLLSRAKETPTQDLWMDTAYQLLVYFEQGQVGAVEPT